MRCLECRPTAVQLSITAMSNDILIFKTGLTEARASVIVVYSFRLSFLFVRAVVRVQLLPPLFFYIVTLN